MVYHMGEDTFDKEVMESDRPVLLDFYADWCGPCRMVAPVLEEIAAEHPELKVAKINVDKAPALAQKFGVVSIPTLVVVQKGVVVDKAVGARPKAAILSLLEGL